MRQIILDTETTGLEVKEGHRVIEIGCVELVNRRLTGRVFHKKLNPERAIDESALKIHGLSNEDLSNQPRFVDIANEFKAFIEGAELIIHNAPFDVGFLDYEFCLLDTSWGGIRACCLGIVDTLVLARRHHPGQRNSLDALCKRYGIDNSQRDLHGALLDAELLCEVYLAMTREQTSIFRNTDSNTQTQLGIEKYRPVAAGRSALKVIQASNEEKSAHEECLTASEKVSGSICLWRSQ